jgi:tetratricopeptide (TPR) repeat protein
MARHGFKSGTWWTRGPIFVLLAHSLSLSACATSGYLHTRSVVSGNQAAHDGNYIDAVAHYEKALAEVPDSPAAKRNLGIVLVKISDYRRAADLLTSIVKNYPEDAEVQYFLGEAHRGLRNFRVAADSYQKGLRIDPTDLRLTKALAWTWFKMGRNDWVINLIEPYLQRSPNDHQIRLILASAYTAKQQFDKAIGLVQFAGANNFSIKNKDKVTAQAEHMLLLTALADGLAGKGDCQKAQPIYTRVLQTRPFLDSALVGSARCNMKAQNIKSAVAQLERAVKSNPNSLEAHFLLARALESSEKNRSLVYFNRYLQLSRDNPVVNTADREHAKRVIASANATY